MRRASAVQQRETITALAARSEVHPSMVSQWKRELLDNAAGLFEGSSGKAAQKSQAGSAGQGREAD